jgi:hypothetical protein
MISGDVTISPQDLATALYLDARTEVRAFPKKFRNVTWTDAVKGEI